MYHKTFHRKKIVIFFALCVVILVALFLRLVYLMVWQADHYAALAEQLHQRERSIKACRGRILDRNGVVIADNKTVCSVSVIYNQIRDPERVIQVLSEELGLTENYVRKRVEKYSSMERIQSNVDKKIGDRIRDYNLLGVKVDEDYKRYYPYDSLGSKVLGFTGGDNQGIIGLEVIYEEVLKGINGTILTMTDAKGIELAKEGEKRVEPQNGNDLQISMDMNIQSYATQLANQVLETKQAEGVSILVMNPQNGEILAMVDVPEFHLNEPFLLPENLKEPKNEKEKQEILNKIWRNSCINDTYEPGSTFKIITAAIGLEEGVVKPSTTFHCPGYIMVEDRRIRCHNTRGHGSQDFVHATMNSCNPSFITVGLNVGVEKYYEHFKELGLLEKTHVDLPGEAGTIMHKMENMKAVELATVSFGQSFQISPIQLLTTVSSILNGGNRVTPHFGMRVRSNNGNVLEQFTYPCKENLVSKETSETLREILLKVVSEGTGKNGKVEGFEVGGKTATSQTIPRGNGKYIASFIGFAPAREPKVIALAIVKHPKGIYYGGQVAAPIVRQLFENILPYLERMDYNEKSVVK